MDLFQPLPLKDPDGLQLSLPLGEHRSGAQVPRGGSRGKHPLAFSQAPSSSPGLPLCTPGGGWVSSLHTRPGTVPKVPLPSLEQPESLGKARPL